MNSNPIQETPDHLKRDEVADILRVSTRTVDRLIADGELPASKIGRAVRINRVDVDALLAPMTPVDSASPHAESAGASSLPSERRTA